MFDTTFAGEIGSVATLMAETAARTSESVRFTNDVQRADRIFLHGAGRSGLVCRFFAMRLLHLGRQVFLVGDTTTPPLRTGDLMVVVTGSGNTPSVVQVAEKASGHGAGVDALTMHRGPGSRGRINELADLTVQFDRRIPPRLGERHRSDHPVTPLGTRFELASLLYLEGVVASLVSAEGHVHDDLQSRHANLE